MTWVFLIVTLLEIRKDKHILLLYNNKVYANITKKEKQQLETFKLKLVSIELK